MSDDVVDFSEKFDRFSDHWSPKLVARINDYEVKLVKVQGDFVWHTHEDCPRADGEVRALLLEPRGVVNTGDAAGELTSVVEAI